MNRVQVGTGDFRYTVDESWAKFPAMGPDGEAVGVACDSKDRVYVFLRGPKPVLVFERDGTPASLLSPSERGVGGEGSWSDVAFTRPHGIFIGKDDTVYCSDDFGHCIRIFSTYGKPRMTLGTPGKPSDTGATSIDYRTIKHSGPPFHYPCNLAIGPTG
ncbi:MAG: hypothetical protein HYR84_12825, partial [Planctomycetes bacterium]|nr:hypothetical protein [Planctomycetota bacterium]